MDQLTEKIESVERTLYGGTISNARELGAIEVEREMVQRQRSGEEDKLLEFMVQFEDLQANAEKARATLEASTGAEPKHRVRVLHALANFYRDRGNYGESQALYEACGELLEQTYGAEHPTWVELLEDQAEQLRRVGKQSAAEEAEARARKIAQTFGVEPAV